ncbi:MAG: phosphoribosylanthranilate isomerase [Anaerolineales bacterium]
MVKIKICGIRTIEEGMWAISAGADFLGFNFYPRSPRAVTVEICREIVRALRQEAPKPLFVGVFVNLPVQRICEILDRCDLDLAQLSGDESLEAQTALGELAYKAIRLTKADNEFFIENLVYQRKTPPALLLDALVPGEYGGTGRLTDWEQAAKIARQLPIFLAGGLNPQNVGEAIRKVKPWGVDVASGVEAIPGQKDRAKLQAFIRNARRVSEEVRKA